MDVEYREGGVLSVALSAQKLRELARGSAWQRGQRLDGPALRRLEPGLSPKAVGAVFYDGDARVDPRLLLRALHVAAQLEGVTFRTGAYVREVRSDAKRVRGVALEDGSELDAKHVVVAAGSWTTLVRGVPLQSDAVRPARGQIVELETPSPVLGRVVFGPRCYLVPRDDGRVLVGSTLEFVGYQRDVTARAVRDLLDAAIELVPSLAQATLRGAWSNFRPYTRDELPLLGPAGAPGLILATGHYRNGILLAPITARIVCALVMGRKSPVDLRPFGPDRAR
jgi:glycine oxidase